jgi:hypothetical protein
MFTLQTYRLLALLACTWQVAELVVTAVMKAPGATLPRLTSKKTLLKSKAEDHSHAEGPPTGSILFHNFFETDLSVVTTPNRFSQNVADFHN